MDVSLESKSLPSVGYSRKSYLQTTSQRLARDKLVYLNGRRPLALSSVGPVQRQGAILDTLFRISEGFYFGSHHLIMVALLHFKEKDELPTKSVPPALAPFMPEATSIVPPTTPLVPLVALSTSEASITISAAEFRVMQHLGLLPPPQPDIPEPSEPIASTEETTRADVPIQSTHEAATKPSSPPETPAP
ncbi:hypothetical protein CK203_101324 [Vitis vinifera]|uniref:Uncharacterized protein n=1 Tax=Vitis vinifera TaxID=29760 RepID=A0A438C5N4_VITVI|nr:hypothetical protein CK203_101324 [Vitis vinifera]